MVINNMIQNFTITESSATNTQIVFGTNLAGNRGNKLQHELDGVVIGYVDISREFFK